MAASDAMGAGDYAKAVELYTTALGLMPSPLTFAKRAECYLKLSKPNAAGASPGVSVLVLVLVQCFSQPLLRAVRDCDAALKLNPDSAKSYKVRGKAKRLLGDYEAAVKDLGTGQNADFDEMSQEALDEVKPFASRAMARRAKTARKAAEKEKKERMKRVARAKKEYEAQKKAEEEEKKAQGGMPGGSECSCCCCLHTRGLGRQGFADSGLCVGSAGWYAGRDARRRGRYGRHDEGAVLRPRGRGAHVAAGRG